MVYLNRNQYGNLELNTSAELLCNNNYIPIVIRDKLYKNINDLLSGEGS